MLFNYFFQKYHHECLKGSDYTSGLISQLINFRDGGPHQIKNQSEQINKLVSI